MNKYFFLNRTFFWSFWANVIFICGMIGYLFMDVLDYRHSVIFNILETDIIYVILACIVVINATLQFFVIYHMNRHTQRYYTMILSCIFDKIGSDAYLLGALFSITTFVHINTIWTFNTIGVCAFVIGAILNMMIPETSTKAICADYFNLLGSLLYLLAIIITRVSLAQILVIFGDIVYLIDAMLYLICWFEDRRMVQRNQYLLLK